MLPDTSTCLPLPAKGMSTPTSWHPVSRQLKSLHVNHSHHSKTQGQCPVKTGPSWDQAPSTMAWSWTMCTPCPARSCQRDMGARQLSPSSSCQHHPHCCRHPVQGRVYWQVVPRICLGDIWGPVQHVFLEPMPPQAGGCPKWVGAQRTLVPGASGFHEGWVQE